MAAKGARQSWMFGVANRWTRQGGEGWRRQVPTCSPCHSTRAPKEKWRLDRCFSPAIAVCQPETCNRHFPIRCASGCCGLWRPLHQSGDCDEVRIWETDDASQSTELRHTMIRPALRRRLSSSLCAIEGVNAKVNVKQQEFSASVHGCLSPLCRLPESVVYGGTARAFRTRSFDGHNEAKVRMRHRRWRCCCVENRSLLTGAASERPIRCRCVAVPSLEIRKRAATTAPLGR